MSVELLVNVTPRETRVAVVENGALQEVFIERARRLGLVGNMYKGLVSRVLPGMQAAFIDIGLQKSAFLHASDIVVPEATGKREVGNITSLLHEGDEVLVQVIKDPLGTKGARLTTRITIPSRYLVFMPSVNSIGVSQRIGDEAERQRLKAIITEELGEQDVGGFILRTAAAGVDEESIVSDLMFLHRLWESVEQKIKESKKGEMVHEDLPAYLARASRYS